MFRRLFITIFLICLFPFANLSASDYLEALAFPEDTVSSRNPYVIWQDKYSGKAPYRGSLFRITVISSEKNTDFSSNHLVYNVYPEPLYDQFYFYRIPEKLSKGSYTLKIEKMKNGRPIRDRRYYYDSYPLNRNFFVEPDRRDEVHFMHPRFYVAYHALAGQRSFYGYDALYSFTAASGAAGIGYAVYRYFGDSIYGKIIAAICFISSGFGYGASAYFTGTYLGLGSDMNEVRGIGASPEKSKLYDEKRLVAEFGLKF